jgi:tetratricopeptide (TPR) repeat protein
MLHYAAIRLFVDRVRAIRPEFNLTSENAAAICAICMRLDGLPLAIELAAARCRALSPQALLQRLGNPLDLLDAGASDLPERQQTLRTTIAWSVALLSKAEQVLFRRLGILARPFTLASAEAVAGSKSDLGIDVLHGLAVLVEHNLIRYVPSGSDDEPRFAMLDTIASYALEQLAEQAEVDAVHQRQETYVLQLVEQAEPGLRGPQQALWLTRLRQEHDNVLLAFQWALHHLRGETAMRLAGGAWWYWFKTGIWHEGRRWLKHVLQDSKINVSPQVRAKVVCGAGVLALFQGDHSVAQSYLAESLALYQQIDELQGFAYAQIFLGLLMLWQGYGTEAVSYLEGCIATFRKLADRWGLAWALGTLGTCTRSLPLLEESGSLWQELGDHWGTAEFLASRGYFALGQRDYVQAASFYAQSLSLYRELDDKRGTALMCRKLGEAIQCQGDYERAKPYYEESLALFSALGHKRDIAWCLYKLGDAARCQGELQAASKLLAESLYLFQQLGLKRDLACIFEELARAAAAQGQTARAVQLLAVAVTMHQGIGTLLAQSEQLERDRFSADLRSRLDATSFAQAWTQGKKLTLQAAAQYALNAP